MGLTKVERMYAHITGVNPDDLMPRPHHQQVEKWIRNLQAQARYMQLPHREKPPLELLSYRISESGYHPTEGAFTIIVAMFNDGSKRATFLNRESIDENDKTRLYEVASKIPNGEWFNHKPSVIDYFVQDTHMTKSGKASTLFRRWLNDGLMDDAVFKGACVPEKFAHDVAPYLPAALWYPSLMSISQPNQNARIAATKATRYSR